MGYLFLVCAILPFGFSCGFYRKSLVVLRLAMLMALILSTASCGGGGNSGEGGGQPARPNFTITLTPASISLPPGGSVTVGVMGQASGGFSDTVTVTFQGLPTGVTASPATFSLSGLSAQTVRLSADFTANAGNTAVEVRGSSASLNPSARLQVTVQAMPNISLSVSPANISLIPGVQQPVEISAAATAGFDQLISGTLTGLPAGVTATSTTFSMLPGSTSTIYLTASTGASGGQVTLNAASGPIAAAAAHLAISIDTTPDFKLATGTNNVLVLSQSSSTKFNLSAAGYNGFSQPVTVSFSGVPAGVTISPSTFILQPGGVSQSITVSTTFSAKPNQQTPITVVGSGGGKSHQLSLDLHVMAATLNLTLQPSPLTIASGSTNSFRVQLLNSGAGTPTGTISLQVTGAPAGVTVSPTTYTAPANGVLMNVYVTAGSGATGGTLSVIAVYGSAQTGLLLPIAIGPAKNFNPVPLTKTDQLIHVDTLTPYFAFPPPIYTVYHAATQRFFSSEAYLNRLYVTDAKSRSLAATLTIPGAFGIDQAPDGSVIYVGTLIGDLYAVDPVSMTIVKRWAASSISSYGFSANAVYALANGKLFLETYFPVPGYSWADGNGPLALWDPVTNDIKVFGGGPTSAPHGTSCYSQVENVLLTANRTRVLMAPVLSSEGSSQLCVLDPEADTVKYSSTLSSSWNSALQTIAAAPDGNTVVAYDGTTIYNLDPATLAVKNSFPSRQANPGGIVPTSVLLVSNDGTSVFLTDPEGSDIFDQYDLATGNLTGWISQLSVASPDTYAAVQPIYQSTTAAGLAAGVIPGAGVGLLDTTAVHPLPLGSRFTQTQLNMTYGPTSGGTATGWLPNWVGVPAPPLGSIYFGPNAASDINNSGTSGMMEAIVPPGIAGPVDVRTFATDGSSQLIPEGYSYGPWVLEAPTKYATAEGGGTGDLFGYGFGPLVYTGGATFTTPPTDLQVNVGGTPVEVTAFGPRTDHGLYFTAPIFPVNALQYRVPPGIAGTSATIGVVNSAGSTVASEQLHYLPELQLYPVPGQLADGVYDRFRDVYYFSDTNQVRVFSLAQKAWLPSIFIPVPSGAPGPQRLMGIAIAPDGTHLAVADAGSIAVHLIDLDHPSSIQTYAYGSEPYSDPLMEVPTAVAITNTNDVYMAASDLNGSGGCGFLFHIDFTNARRIEVGPGMGNCLPTQGGLVGTSLAASADGTRIFYNDSGLFGYLDVATGVFGYPLSTAQYLAQGGYEVAVSGDGKRVLVDGLLADTNLNSIGVETLNMAQGLDAQYLYGGVFSADGSLFFQPGTQAIDIFDGITGAFAGRVALSITLSSNFRALVPNYRDDQVVAILGDSGNAIGVIDLSSLPKPNASPWLSAAPAPAPEPGVVVRLAPKKQNSSAWMHRRTSSLLKR